MMRKILLAISAIVFICFGTGNSAHAADTVLHRHMWENYDQSGRHDSSFFSSFKENHFIEASTGTNKISIHEDYFTRPFEDNGNIEFRIGSSSKKRMFERPGFVKYNDNFLFGAHYADNYFVKESETLHDVKLNLLQFGFGSTSGYGYRLGENSDVIFYHGSSLAWSKPKFERPTGADSLYWQDDDRLDVYGSAIRFGTIYDGGIRIQPLKFLSIKLGYQRQVVFPRHLFWKWLGSEVVEGIGQGLVDGFIDHMFKASPVAGPVVYFVLKNGISYGVYELRKKYMNWPFKTVSPLFLETYKLGLTIQI